MKEKDALAVAGETADRSMFELGMKSGAVVMAMYQEQASAYARLQLVKQIRESGQYKQLAGTWDEYCTTVLGQGRMTVERQLDAAEKHGPSYIDMQALVRVTPREFEQLDVQDGTLITASGERVAITRQNAAVIRTEILAVREELNRAKERQYKAAEKSKSAELKQKTAEQRARELESELHEHKNRAALAWSRAEGVYRELLVVQQEMDFNLAKLAFEIEKLPVADTENAQRALGLAEYVWSRAAAVADDARRRFGQGVMAADPAVLAEVETMTPAKRNLIAEYEAKGAKK